jgi:hypothetical protein
MMGGDLIMKSGWTLRTVSYVALSIQKFVPILYLSPKRKKGKLFRENNLPFSSSSGGRNLPAVTTLHAMFQMELE